MSNKKKEFFLVRWFKRCFLHERPELSSEEEEKIQTPMRAMVSNFVHRPLAMFGLIVFLAIFVFVMVGPHIWVLDLSEQDSTLTNLPPSRNMMEVPKALLANGVKDISSGNTYGVGIDELDHEGRMITLEYEKFYLVTCYTPNAQDGLKRIDHRLSWDDAFREKLLELDAKKPVIACGDLNVAHQEIDLKNPGPNRGNPGFSDEERESFTRLLDAGFTDTFRYRNPTLSGAYSWWSYRFHAREKNAGWRIDYFLVSDRLQPAIEAAPIYDEIFGSDHCPVGLELKEELL